MPDNTSKTTDFFDAIRNGDLPSITRLLHDEPTLAQARWPGRAGDGKMRSLGPSPFNKHTWQIAGPHDADDPRFTSTPLIYTRNDQVVRLLVEAGADVNAKGTSGEIELPDWYYTPLWRAAHDNRLASVSLMIERGADVNFQNPDGSNQALKTAAENDAIETCKYLMEHGAKPDLITAAMLGLPQQVQEILQTNAHSIHAQDSHGRSPLDAATLMDTFRKSKKGLHEGHRQAALLLIQHGAKVELEHAASLGLIDEARKWIAKDSDLLRRPKIIPALIGGAATMESPLSTAQRNGHEELAAFLQQHGATTKPTIIIQ